MAKGNEQKEKLPPEFGKATMYVISEHGLQTGPFIYDKTTDSRVYLDSSMYSGRKLNVSQTKPTEISWRGGTSSALDKKVRILDLNGLVDVCLEKRGYNARRFAGAANQDETPKQTTRRLPESKHVNRHSTSEMNYVSYSGNIRGSFARLKRKGARTDNLHRKAIDEADEKKSYMDKWFRESQELPYSNINYQDSLSRCEAVQNPTDSTAFITERKDSAESTVSYNTMKDNKPLRAAEMGYLKRVFYPKGSNYPTISHPKRLPQIVKPEEKATEETRKVTRMEKSKTAEMDVAVRQENHDLLEPLRVGFPAKNSEKHKQNFQSIIKLPNVVDHKTGRVHLPLKDVSYEQSDYNKWSRKEKQIRTENRKGSNFAFPLIAKNSR